MAISATKSLLKDIGIPAEALLAVNFIHSRGRTIEILTHADRVTCIMDCLKSRNIKASSDTAPDSPDLLKDGSAWWMKLKDEEKAAEAHRLYQTRLQTLMNSSRRPSVQGYCARLLRESNKHSSRGPTEPEQPELSLVDPAENQGMVLDNGELMQDNDAEQIAPEESNATSSSRARTRSPPSTNKRARTRSATPRQAVASSATQSLANGTEEAVSGAQ